MSRILRQEVTGRLYAYTEALSKRSDMREVAVVDTEAGEDAQKPDTKPKPAQKQAPKPKTGADGGQPEGGMQGNE